MLRFIARRLLQSAIVLFLFLTVVFFLSEFIMTGDFAIISRWGQGVEEVQALREELGLTEPLWQRYITWMAGVLTGNLGETYNVYRDPITLRNERVPVSTILGMALLLSTLISVTGMFAAFRIGESLGKALAWRRAAVISGVVTLVGIVLYTSFPLLLTFTAIEITEPLAFFCPPRCLTPTLWRPDYVTPIGHIPAFMIYLNVSLLGAVLCVTLVDALLQRRFRRRLPTLVYILLFIGLWAGGWALTPARPWTLDFMRSIILMFVLFVMLTFGETMIIMQSSMTDTLYEDYVFTARAVGLPDRVIRDRHAARNAMLPVLSRFIINIPYLLAGLVMIERGIGFGGVGSLLLASLDTRDRPAFMGIFVVIGIFAVVARLVLDIMIAWLDPRIRATTPALGNPAATAWDRAGRPRLLPRRGARRRRPPTQAAKVGEGAVRLSIGKYLAAQSRQLRMRLRTRWKRLNESWEIFTQNRLAVVGLVLIGVFAIMAVIHPILMNHVWPRAIYHPMIGHDPAISPHPSSPSLQHWLGTDPLGRDVLSILLASTPSTFAVALPAALSAAVVGTLLGAAAAYYRGTVIDTILGYVSDVLLAMPAPILMIILGTRYQESLGGAEFGLLYGVLAGASIVFIMMRAQAMKLMAQPFVEASRVAGAGAGRIIFHHLIPHLLPLTAAQMMMTVASAVITYAFISFVGVVEFELNWGAMIYFALTMSVGAALNARISWGQLLAPGICLSLFAAAFYLVSRGLHEVAEPRLRGR
jgi:peptide/nickel transport system permease protein